MAKVFLAFGGREEDNSTLSQVKKIIVAKNLVLYNLKKYSKASLESEILSLGIMYKYKHITDDFELSGYKKFDKEGSLCRGIYLDEVDVDYNECLFFLELYLNKFLSPLFAIREVGYQPLDYERLNVRDDNVSGKIGIEFLGFLNLVASQKVYIGYSSDQVIKWIGKNNKEPFRYLTATNLYRRLKDRYAFTKESFFGLIEMLDISVILENLFTHEGEKESIGRMLKKRIHLLTGGLVSDVEKHIKDLYNFRSRYAHGNIHIDLFKGFKNSGGKWPLLTYRGGEFRNGGESIFDLSKRYTTILRIILILIYKVDLDLQSTLLPIGKYGSIIELLDDSMYDITLKDKITQSRDEIWGYMVNYKC